MYISSSFIIAACIQAQTIALGFTFFGVGVVSIIIFSFGYEFSTKYDDRQAIQNQNSAAGLNWALNLVAFGMLMARSISISNSIWMYLVWMGIGCLTMGIYRKVIDAVIIPELNLDDELSVAQKTDAEAGLNAPKSTKNWGVALLAGVMTVSLVQCLNTFIRDCDFELSDPH